MKKKLRIRKASVPFACEGTKKEKNNEHLRLSEEQKDFAH